MNINTNIRNAAVLLLAALSGVAFAEDTETRDEAAFAQLKSLVGTWQDVPEAGAEPTRVTYELASGGKAVIERLIVGTPKEMITVYFLASGKLRATHYCSIGNQPAFALSSDEDGKLTFAFDGGTGFDPATDGHVHEGYLKRVAEDRLESGWTHFNGGRNQGSVRWLFHRQ